MQSLVKLQKMLDLTPPTMQLDSRLQAKMILVIPLGLFLLTFECLLQRNQSYFTTILNELLILICGVPL